MAPRTPKGTSSALIGQGPAMQELKRLIERVARSDARVLITGENGTGKELVAAAIHASSARAKEAFIKLNCGAVASDLIESELFGHEKGAFTDAIATRKGRFELADRGTLLLDEVGEMPISMQVKLLRVLQEGHIERVGGSASIEVDVRVLAATNRDLGQMVRDGSFREDLYYRLNVLTLPVPPLRARREDIPLLLRYFARKGGPGAGLDFTEDAIELLARQDYPGNVRELSNVVERLSILHGSGRIEPEQVREVFALSQGSGGAELGPAYRLGHTLRSLLHEFERRVIVEAIATHGHSKTAAAHALGTDRSQFYKKCRLYGIGD